MTMQNSSPQPPTPRPSGRPVRHGLSGTKVYKSWERLTKTRLDVETRWYIFENFFHDMGHPPGQDYCLRRIDRAKGFSKENCRWIHKNSKRANLNNTESS